jgi:uncharacterized surface protein with fasciclin (FAS1) repeats
MTNGAKTTLHVDGDKVAINDARVVASIRASNGMVHDRRKSFSARQN